MKLFGKDLFNFKKPSEPMYDFAQHGLLSANQTMTYLTVNDQGNLEKPKKKEVKKIYITPKGIFYMKSLNANKFSINADRGYIEQQILDAKEKLALLPKERKQRLSRDFPQPIGIGPIGYGRLELESIIERLENRKRLDEFKTMLEKYPHTTSDLMALILKENENLRCQGAGSFVPDFPKDAINAMTEYDEMCVKLCNKKAVFYVIAQHQDFEKVTKRRDPILLAQSPFGFFWQILGAWDEEMVYLADL